MASTRTSSAQSVLVQPHTARGGAKLRKQRARRGVLGSESGVLIVPQQVRGRAVTRGELAQAAAAVRALPAADVALLARHGIRINLFPVAALDDGLLGATTIVQDEASSPWRPTLIRVAARADQQPVGEIVQHEVGHAVAVLRGQDRSEDAANSYAARY